MTTPDDKAGQNALKLLQKAGESLAWTAGYIGMPWAKLKGKAKADASIETYSIGADGVLSVNPTWLAGQRHEERVFELAASMMRFLLRHHDRGVSLGIVDPETGAPTKGQEHEHSLWGKACASIVNHALREDSIGKPPADCVFPPEDYTGAQDAESLYYHLLKVTPKPPPSGGQGQQPSSPPPNPPPHAGGHPQPPGGKGEEGDDENDPAGQGPGQSPSPQASGGDMSPDDIDQLRRSVEALAKMAGKGTHIVDALTPRVARTNYRNVIGAGLDFATTESSERTTKTYSRASRREGLLEGLVLPGYLGADPSICIEIDKSGSTEQYAQKFIDHAFKVAKDYPNVKMYLVVHTDRVCWEGWVKPGGDSKILHDASRFSGGTSFAPGYEAAKKVAPRGKFDALVHFTDGYNFGPWPMPPARRLVVGLCGDGDTEGITPLPMPAKVIPISMGEDRR